MAEKMETSCLYSRRGYSNGSFLPISFISNDSFGSGCAYVARDR